MCQLQQTCWKRNTIHYIHYILIIIVVLFFSSDLASVFVAWATAAFQFVGEIYEASKTEGHAYEETAT